MQEHREIEYEQSSVVHVWKVGGGEGGVVFKKKTKDIVKIEKLHINYCPS